MKLLTILLSASLAGWSGASSSQNLLELKPIYSGQIKGDYQVIAGCAYEQLETKFSALRKIELPNSKSVRISLDLDVVRRWEFRFKASGKSSTTVEILSALSLWGPMDKPEDLLPFVRACQ